MFAKFVKWKKVWFGVTVIFTVLLICGATVLHNVAKEAFAVIDITNLKSKVSDDKITLSWTPLSKTNDTVIEIMVYGQDRDYTTEIAANKSSFIFTNGTHGNLYEFTVRAKCNGEYISVGQNEIGMFLDWEKLPDLPIVSVDTVTDYIPMGEWTDSPEGAWGATATKEYVDMKITVEDDNHIVMNASGQIRIRGNTSSAAYKKPYKIKLEQSMDLLQDDNAIKRDTEWILLPHMYTLKTETGNIVASLCGSEWQPSYTPVNLIVDGDWVGSYLIIENIKVGENRINIESNGFIIENDAYWWHADGIYFKSPYQNSHLGYTFTYPEIKDMEHPEAMLISNYVTTYEKLLVEGDKDYEKYLDLDSAAMWLLTHDILGSGDAGGSNMYYYKNSLTATDQFSSKMKMGPPWDFDSAYMREKDWSVVHSTTIQHFDVLLSKDEFKSIYIAKWKQLSDSLSKCVESELNDYIALYGNSIEESWELDAARWKTEVNKPQVAINNTLNWMNDRTEWLNNAIGDLK